MYGRLFIAHNTATDSGGGIHLYQSELNCEKKGILGLFKNSAGERGGAIYASSSLIKMEYGVYNMWDFNNTLKLVHTVDYSGSHAMFAANDAKLGGGICLEVNSKFYILIHSKTINIKFCLLYTSPSPRDQRGSRMPSSA